MQPRAEPEGRADEAKSAAEAAEGKAAEGEAAEGKEAAVGAAEGSRRGRDLLSPVLPTAICKILSNAVIIINLWWSRSDGTFITVGMGLATIFSFVFGYLLMSSLNIGLTYEISRKRRNKELIGIFYQRTLLVNFLFCVFVITPILYLSKNVVRMFRSVDYIRTDYAYEEIGETVGKYLYQLVPSIYAFAFYDTTQSFLLAQGHILAPLLIQVVAIAAHLVLIQHLGPAWSKNTIDFLSSVAVYTYIVTLRKPLGAWIEWTIKCMKGWGNYLKFLEIICFTTYLQGLFFFFFCCLGYRLEREELGCHIFYINIYQLLYLLYIGIKEGALIKIGLHIKKNQYEQYRTEGVRSIKVFVLISSAAILFLYIYEQEVCDFFFEQQAHARVFREQFYLLATTVIIDSFQMGMSSLLKALNRHRSVLKFNICFYSLSLLLCYYLCYARELGIKGLWMGWIIGLTCNSVFSLVLLLRTTNNHVHHALRRTEQLKEIQEEPENKENEEVFVAI